MIAQVHAELTEKIICCFYNVYNSLGYGFLEKVYEKALHLELNKFGLKCDVQMPVSVYYSGEVIGEYFSDLLVNQSVIVEIKALQALVPAHEAQLLNYLKATDIEVGLLLNFGPEPQIKRKIFTNQNKKNNKQWCLEKRRQS